jgi:DNA-binding GntR family transcriptional regulator
MKPETESSQVYARLRDSIIRTELRPGATLSENELMQQFDIGRTPLRDALQRLGHEGLVEIRPRKGTTVTQVTLRDLQQVFEVRIGLEDIVARLAAERCTDAHLEEMRRLCDLSQMGTPGAESDVQLDADLHVFLLSVTSNELLARLYARVADSSLRLLYLTRCGMESTEDQQKFFQGIYDALALRDSKLLTTILRQHVQAFRDRVQTAVFRNGDF